MRSWPKHAHHCPLCKVSATSVPYGGGGVCDGCKQGANELERSIRGLIATPEGSDLWTFGVALRSWGITGIADELNVERDIVCVWVVQAAIPSPYLGKVRELWSGLSQRAGDWGIAAQGKSGRRRAG